MPQVTLNRPGAGRRREGELALDLPPAIHGRGFELQAVLSVCVSGQVVAGHRDAKRLRPVVEPIPFVGIQRVGNGFALVVPAQAQSAMVQRVGRLVPVRGPAMLERGHPVGRIKRQAGIPHGHQGIPAIVADRIEVPPLLRSRRAEVDEAIGIESR